MRARALRAPVFLSSLTCKAGRCAPPPRLSQLRCSCLDHTLCILRRALQIHHLVKGTKKFSFHWTTEALKKGTIVYYIIYYIYISPTLTAWAGVGGSKSYDSKETLVRYSILYVYVHNTHFTTEAMKYNVPLPPPPPPPIAASLILTAKIHSMRVYSSSGLQVYEI